jgi:antitoxin component of MazEF toxin-antitoxin module
VIETIIRMVKIGCSKGFIIPKEMLKFFGYTEDIGYELKMDSNEIRIRKTDIRIFKKQKIKVKGKDKTIEMVL